MGAKPKEWVLSDNSKWTAMQVANYVGIGHSSAYHRLSKSADRDIVLRKAENVKRLGGKRLYILDDGSEWTSTMVANHTGCLLSTASTRLGTYTDPAKVLAPPPYYVTKGRTVSAAIKERMYYDPLGHWALLNKHV
jgi:hypothetical protein